MKGGGGGFRVTGGTGMLGQNVIMSGDESAQRATHALWEPYVVRGGINGI